MKKFIHMDNIYLNPINISVGMLFLPMILLMLYMISPYEKIVNFYYSTKKCVVVDDWGKINAGEIYVIENNIDFFDPMESTFAQYMFPIEIASKMGYTLVKGSLVRVCGFLKDSEVEVKLSLLKEGDLSKLGAYKSPISQFIEGTDDGFLIIKIKTLVKAIKKI
ncbi:hypothetical protein KKH36_00915 [Patescibacteria group bacterium]|nr:hypothetical protein [Patescibacteria group bacterium]